MAPKRLFYVCLTRAQFIYFFFYRELRIRLHILYKFESDKQNLCFVSAAFKVTCVFLCDKTDLDKAEATVHLIHITRSDK